MWNFLFEGRIVILRNVNGPSSRVDQGFNFEQNMDTLFGLFACKYMNLNMHSSSFFTINKQQ